MTTVTIQIPDKETKTLLEFVKKIGGKTIVKPLTQAQEDKALFNAMEETKNEEPLSKEEQEAFINSLGK